MRTFSLLFCMLAIANSFGIISTTFNSTRKTLFKNSFEKELYYLSHDFKNSFTYPDYTSQMVKKAEKMGFRSSFGKLYFKNQKNDHQHGAALVAKNKILFTTNLDLKNLESFEYDCGIGVTKYYPIIKTKTLYYIDEKKYALVKPETTKKNYPLKVVLAELDTNIYRAKPLVINSTKNEIRDVTVHNINDIYRYSYWAYIIGYGPNYNQNTFSSNKNFELKAASVYPNDNKILFSKEREEVLYTQFLDPKIIIKHKEDKISGACASPGEFPFLVRFRNSVPELIGIAMVPGRDFNNDHYYGRQTLFIRLSSIYSDLQQEGCMTSTDHTDGDVSCWKEAEFKYIAYPGGVIDKLNPKLRITKRIYTNNKVFVQVSDSRKLCSYSSDWPLEFDYWDTHNEQQNELNGRITFIDYAGWKNKVYQNKITRKKGYSNWIKTYHIQGVPISMQKKVERVFYQLPNGLLIGTSGLSPYDCDFYTQTVYHQHFFKDKITWKDPEKNVFTIYPDRKVVLVRSCGTKMTFDCTEKPVYTTIFPHGLRVIKKDNVTERYYFFGLKMITDKNRQTSYEIFKPSNIDKNPFKLQKNKKKSEIEFNYGPAMPTETLYKGKRMLKLVIPQQNEIRTIRIEGGNVVVKIEEHK